MTENPQQQGKQLLWTIIHPALVEQIATDSKLWAQLKAKFPPETNATFIPWKIFATAASVYDPKTPLVDFLKPPNPPPPKK